MSTPAVSVVIPVHNAGPTLAAAIDSALGQQAVPIEVLVVDDGSTSEETRRIICSYGDRIRSLWQPNAGPAAARNTGVSNASHEWIAFLDQDDLWEPEKLMVQIQVALESGADVIYTNARNFGELERVGGLRNDPDTMPSGDIFEALLLDNFLTMAGVMMRKSVLLEAGGFRPDVAGVDDWAMWLTLSASGIRFAAVKEPLTRYRWHSTSLSKRHHVMKELRDQVLISALNSPRGRKVPWTLKRQAMARVRGVSAWFIAAQEPVQAAVWYAESLAYWPFELGSWKGLVKACIRRA